MLANMHALIHVLYFALSCGKLEFQGPFYLSYDFVSPPEETPMFNFTYWKPIVVFFQNKEYLQPKIPAEINVEFVL